MATTQSGGDADRAGEADGASSPALHAAAAPPRAPSSSSSNSSTGDDAEPEGREDAAAGGREHGAPSTAKADDVDSVGEDELTGGGKDAPPPETAGRPGDSAGAPAGRAAAPPSPATHDAARPMADDALSRRCYVSGVTEDSLCVHTPFCVRHTGIVYVAETLKCAPYSNMHGITGTLSTRRCVEVERDVEHQAEISDPEHKSQAWLDALDKDGKLQWYEGETVFLSLSAKARSVAHYSQRIFFLHHVLLHPGRYGIGRVSNVVVAAEPEVARKIKFRKSWHYGLLAAIVHPNKPVFRHREMRELVAEGAARPGVVRVFVPSGLDNLAKGRQVPCFRRAVIPGALHSQYLLTQDRYPGTVTHGVGAGRGEDAAVAAAHKRGKYFDGAMLRRQVFSSLDRDEPPLRRRLVYLHRAAGRVLTAAGRGRLEAALREVAAEVGYEYGAVDLAGKSFSEQVDAVAGAAVAVGVHGMQLMSALFMPGDAALIEIFPYKFWHELYADGCGAGLSYQSMSIARGEDHADVAKYGGLEACVSSSRDCRLWYRSDNRALALAAEDASEVQRMVREAVNTIARAAAAAGAAAQ
jgi:hypothetical protein